MNCKLPIVIAALAMPANAEETRQLASHEHGVGELNIAFDGNAIAMELHAPGADIVGFEYEATSEADLAAIAAAIAELTQPFELFILPASAECSVVYVNAELESEHDDASNHSEFHAEYLLTCKNPDAITQISFAYFDAFKNAQELEVQVVSDKGAQAFEIDRAEPTLKLSRF